MNESTAEPLPTAVPPSFLCRFRAPLIACAGALALLLAGGGVATGMAISTPVATAATAPQYHAQPGNFTPPSTSGTTDAAAASDAW